MDIIFSKNDKVEYSDYVAQLDLIFKSSVHYNGQTVKVGNKQYVAFGQFNVVSKESDISSTAGDITIVDDGVVSSYIKYKNVWETIRGNSKQENFDDAGYPTLLDESVKDKVPGVSAGKFMHPEYGKVSCFVMELEDQNGDRKSIMGLSGLEDDAKAMLYDFNTNSACDGWWSLEVDDDNKTLSSVDYIFILKDGWLYFMEVTEWFNWVVPKDRKKYFSLSLPYRIYENTSSSLIERSTFISDLILNKNNSNIYDFDRIIHFSFNNYFLQLKKLAIYIKDYYFSRIEVTIRYSTDPEVEFTCSGTDFNGILSVPIQQHATNVYIKIIPFSFSIDGITKYHGKIGSVVIGEHKSLGKANLNFEGSAIDFSYKNIDEYGNETLVPRPKAKKFTFSVDIESDDFNSTYKDLKENVGLPVVVNPVGESSRFRETITYGRYADFKMRPNIKNGNIENVTYDIDIEEYI